jgi:beta-glucosidase
MDMITDHSPSWADDRVAERVEELVSAMTAEEKVTFVTGDLNFNYGFYNAPLERLGIPALRMADGPAGVRINRGDVHDGRATSLPAPIALAATWDPGLAHRYGAVIGAECLATDHNVSLGPAVDIARVPLAGRTFESFGEDPLLTSEMGVAVARGVQSHPVQACAKHFAVNNQEYQRATIDAVVDERSLMEIYLPPFEAVVHDGEVASVMAAFNRVNGIYACENAELLTTILRDQFGFHGWVMSDYGANHSTAASANAGLDQEQPAAGHWGEQLAAAVRDGQVEPEVLDAMVRHVLTPMVGLGQLERRPRIAPFPVRTHHALARQVAEEGTVLLRNNGLLPLDATALRSIAVIGPDVDAATAQGGGSSLVKPTLPVGPREAIRRRLGDDVQLNWAYGTDGVTPAALLPGPDPMPSDLFSPGGDAGPEQRGLRAQYWNNAAFSGDPFLERVDPQVDLNLGFFNFEGFNAASARVDKLPGDLNGQTSVRWTGDVRVPTDGTYTLSVTALGAFELSLDDHLLISSGDPAGDGSTTSVTEPVYPYGQLTLQGSATQPEVHDVEVPLVAGTPYRVRMDYAAVSPEQGFLTGAQVRLGWRPPAGVVAPSVISAAALAAAADVAVVVVRDYESEHADRPHLHLPNGQDDLVRAVVAANPRTVVVVMTGAPVDMTSWIDGTAAVLQAWYPGQAQGEALARVLFGDAEPGGRLPLTFPRDLAHTPVTDPRHYPGTGGRVEYADGVFVGYRAYDEHGLDPLFPFGHGLSYTTFAYDDLEIGPGAGDDLARLTVTVTNTGDRDGSEVIQAYLGRLPAPVPTPPRRLAGYRKVRLAPGQSERVQLTIPARAASYWDVGAHGWTRAKGDVELFVGASSGDLRLSTTFPIP